MSEEEIIRSIGAAQPITEAIEVIFNNFRIQGAAKEVDTVEEEASEGKEAVVEVVFEVDSSIVKILGKMPKSQILAVFRKI